MKFAIQAETRNKTVKTIRYRVMLHLSAKRSSYLLTELTLKIAKLRSCKYLAKQLLINVCYLAVHTFSEFVLFKDCVFQYCVPAAIWHTPCSFCLIYKGWVFYQCFTQVNDTQKVSFVLYSTVSSCNRSCTQ